MQKCHKVPVGGNSFSSKVKIWGMLWSLLEYIPEYAMYKQLLWNFNKIKVCGWVCILKIAKNHTFAGALKACFLFQKKKKKSNQNKVVNRNTESLVKALHKL